MTDVDAVLRRMAEIAVARREDWDALDAVAADGDFGTTMARGFGAVLAQWPELSTSDSRTRLPGVASVLDGEMGGSSGPLLAEGFRRAGQVLDEATGTVVDALSAGIEGIRARGGADVGDKTMLDALIPAERALRTAVGSGERDGARLAETAAAAALTGALGTAGYAARRGRAAYSGERSIGAVDPGAMAVAVVLNDLATSLGGSPPELPGSEASTAVATKQFVNDPDHAVDDALAGFAAAHADVVWDPERRIVVRSVVPAGLVGLVSGGGSGHEPMHTGFVGPGMLTAVAPGPVFASPTVDQVTHATLAADGGAGVLHIVKNYTGDVLNFQLAAKEAGAEVRTVRVADDVGVDDTGHDIGRRGTGATILVHKVAGAKAQAGAPLDEVARVAEHAAGRAASFGIGLGSCSPPGRGPIADLGAGEIEVGIGIHGEPGRRRDVPRPAGELVDEAVTTILAALDAPAGSDLLAFVSGLGATPLLEQYIVFGEVLRAVTTAGHRITRRLVGPYLTALDMPGVVITLLRLDDELTGLWDAPVHTPALSW
jgi:dihydroxyacetone kinase